MKTKLRRSALQRDQQSCRGCGADEKGDNLHVHHIVPRSSGGEDRLSNLATLCTDCHSAVHGRDGVAHGSTISQGIKERKKEEDYHHGPAPLGFEKENGRLIEGPEYQRVVAVLDNVASGEQSKRQAAKKLDCTRHTIKTAVEERADLYGL